MKKIFCISSLFFVLCVFGQSSASFVVPPLPSTPVYDEVGLLKSDEKQSLEQTLLTLEQTTHHQVAIAIIKSLQNRPIEEVSITIARAW